jgi:peroxiredoxin
MLRLSRLLQVVTKTVLAGFLCIFVAGLGLFDLKPARAQLQQPVWTSDQKPIADKIQNLRSLPDDVRALSTNQLALQIRQLPASANKMTLAYDLATLSTEGDFGRATLQEVTATLAASLQEHPAPAVKGQPAEPYIELAELVRYEHMEASLENPQFAAAMAKLKAEDVLREHANFTLLDLQGKAWTLRDLRGKVVLVNFWATWCPPCRKEIPDLETLYKRFKDQDLVVLAISDENAAKVQPFIDQAKVAYPVLLDPGRKVNNLFQVDGIPKSFVYDRTGKLVAQSIDMRTQKQFLAMLSAAGLQ